MRKGGVILYPTDTVWGIGCDATNAEAVARVYRIKQRDDAKALICLVDSDDRLQRYVRQVPAVAWDLIDATTDRPTTLVLDHAVNLAPNLISEDGSVGIRITNEAFSKALCYRMQKAIVSTSANISGMPTAQNYRDIDPRHPRGRRLRLRDQTAGAQAPQAVEYHQADGRWRSDGHQKISKHRISKHRNK